MRSPNPSVGSDQPMLALTGPDPWGCWKRSGMQWKLNSSVYTRMSAKEFAIGIDDGDESSDRLIDDGKQDNGGSSAWRLLLRHVCVAIITSFLFGYHVGVVNELLENIAMDLGFSGNTMAEGLVVSMCLGGAFIGCMFSDWIADGIGRLRAFQLSAVPMIVGPCLSATSTTLNGMLLGRFLVRMGMGVDPPVASLYVTEVSPPSVRGTYGSFIQIATCLGILGALFFGTPVKEVVGWWRVCFWVSVIPTALLAFGMEFSAESPHWLYKFSLFPLSHLNIFLGSPSEVRKFRDRSCRSHPLAFVRLLQVCMVVANFLRWKMSTSEIWYIGNLLLANGKYCSYTRISRISFKCLLSVV